jgi:8-oxo-dGTP pyrophosphatase MutT (NUDIX family)
MLLDIKVDIGDIILNCRAAGFIVKNNKILVHKEKKQSFWAPIGGKIKTMESSIDAVKREYKEELRFDVEIERLLWIAENFFEFESKKYHEYTFIYLLSDKNNVLNCEDQNFLELNSTQFEYKWFDFEEINTLYMKPGFLNGTFDKFPELPIHVVYSDYQ